MPIFQKAHAFNPEAFAQKPRFPDLEDFCRKIGRQGSVGELRQELNEIRRNDRLDFVLYGAMKVIIGQRAERLATERKLTGGEKAALKHLLNETLHLSPSN